MASSSTQSTYIGCRPMNELGSQAWLSLYETTFEEILTRSVIILPSPHTITRGEIEF